MNWRFVLASLTLTACSASEDSSPCAAVGGCASGEACVRDADGSEACKSLCYASCDCASPTQACVEGVCQEVEALACESSIECMTGDYCNHAGGQCERLPGCVSTCADGIWDDRRESAPDCGGECPACDNGQACVDDNDCAEGNTCDANACNYCGDGVARADPLEPHAEECGEPELPGCPAFFACQNCRCVSTPPVLAIDLGLRELRFSWARVNGATHYRLLRNLDDGAGWVQLGADLTGTNYTQDIVVFAAPTASYQLAACHGDGCMTSAPLLAGSDLTPAIGYFKAPNTDAGDHFGEAIALSDDGNTLAIGAPYEDSSAQLTGGAEALADNFATSAGAVYVFTRTDSGWGEPAYVKAFNTEPGDFFGAAVALSADGSTLVVGATGEDSNASGIDGDENDNSDTGAGAVYVYVKDGANWARQAYIKPSNNYVGVGFYFGGALALSHDGNTLAVGATGEDSDATLVNGNENSNAAGNAGAVYVYARSGATWEKQAYVKASYTVTSDYFGSSVALSNDGNTLAVAAGNGDPDHEGDASGAVYVYSRAGSTWSFVSKIRAPNARANDYFGSSLALAGDGTTLAVGAAGEDSNAVGVDGDKEDDSAESAGAVYVFTRGGAQFDIQAYLKAANTDAQDRFGSSLALSNDGNTLVVGAVYEAGNAIGIGDEADWTDNSLPEAGAVYVFTRSGASFSQVAYVKAPNTDEGDRFGSSLALSGDGDLLVVATELEDSGATGIGGDRADNSASTAGAVYLY